MGNKSSSPPKAVEPPVALHVFKCLDGVPMEYSIPEVPEKRKPTDRFFLILFIVMYAALGVLTIYMMMYSDLKRTTNGYDNCGNVCGEKNDPVDGINCTGKDYTNENILMYERDSALVNLDNLDMEPSECVENCEEFGYLRILNRCFKISDFDDDKKEKAELELVIDMQVIKDLQASLGHIVGMVFIALGICFIILLLFKYFVSIMVKSIVISTVILSVGLAIYMWCFKTEYSTTAKWFVLIYCIIICVGAALSWRKINFVIRIFNETTKAVFDMPSLMLIPIWVFLIEIILIGLFIFLMIMYTTSGVLTHLYGPYYTYSLTSLMMFTIVYTLFMFLYSGAFLGGCQQVVVSGAISTWYFTREKDNILGSPVADSLRILTKYHLGSVAFGSLVISVMKFIRLAIKGMLKKKEFVCFRLMMNLCLDFVEEFIHYVSNQAYIMVAMHGQPFIESGKRATKLLIENALNTLGVNTAGDFVLWLAKFFVAVLTVICGMILDDGNIMFYGVALVIGGILATLLAHSIFKNFEICVDTIFLAYCEDSFIHDGIEHPYYAPVEIMMVIDEAKGVLEEEKIFNSVKEEELPPSFV